MNDELHGAGARGADATAAGQPEAASGSAVDRTGVASVDRVLADIQQIGELSVAERVAVFERVHEELRRSLDADPSTDIAGA